MLILLAAATGVTLTEVCAALVAVAGVAKVVYETAKVREEVRLTAAKANKETEG